MAETDWNDPTGSRAPYGSNGKHARSFSEHATDTRDHAQAFAESFGAALKDVDDRVRAVAQGNPYLALGTALGLGYILGGGIPPMLVRGLVSFASRYALATVMSTLVATEVAKETTKETLEGRER